MKALKFKKITCDIAVSLTGAYKEKSYQTVNGWIIKIKPTGFKKYIYLLLHKNNVNNRWVASEFTTGYQLCHHSPNRNGALHKALALLTKVGEEIYKKEIATLETINQIPK